MGKTRVIIAGSLLNGSGADVRRNVFMAMKDGIIATIGSAVDFQSDEETFIDDFSHCTILPALVDCSVSLLQSPSVDDSVRLNAEKASFEKRAVMMEQHISYCHIHGALGVAACDINTDLVDRYQERVEKGSGIDIRTSGGLCRSKQDFAAVNSAGVDFLKISYSNNIEDDETTYPRLNKEDLYSILCNSSGKKVVVVANGPKQVQEALAAGCHAIEQGYDMGEDNLKKMVEEDVLWIPSVLRAKNALDSACTGGNVCCRFSHRYVAPGKPVPGAEAFWKKMLTEQLKQLRFARKLGVKTAVGTGAGSVGILHGESMAEEMKLFIKAGYSLAETIRCASENGAIFFGMEKLGRLTVGRKATFLISRGTVKQLPRKLSYLEGIYIDGLPSKIYHKNPVKPL